MNHAYAFSELRMFGQMERFTHGFPPHHYQQPNQNLLEPTLLTLIHSNDLKCPV